MKRIQQLKDIRDIKSMRAACARSIPKALRSGYLELYTCTREKDRLEKDMFALDRRKNGIQKRLVDVNKWMKKLRQEPSGGHKITTVNNILSRRVKMQSVKY